jgi:hypothetical protein
MKAQEWKEKVYHIFGRRRIDLQSDYTWVLTERQDYPVTEMFIQGNKNPILGDRLRQYLLIICSGLPEFGGTHNIVTFTTQSPS